MTTTDTIEVTVNGERRSLPSSSNVREVLVALKIDPAKVAVELNRAIVRQAEWDRVEVPAGSNLEIVQFVGGG